MRIPAIGFAVFLIWSLFSTWLYVEKIQPAMNEPVVVLPIPETDSVVADIIVEKVAPEPEDLIIYFEFDKAIVTTDQKADDIIGKFREWLDLNPASKITITGHTDSKGASDYNQRLGLKRAMSVQKYFTTKNILPDRIETVSRGETEPAGDQSTEEGRAKSRRTVITIKK